MTSWIAVTDAIPWLPPPPYFVQTDRARTLRDILRELGFSVFETEEIRAVNENEFLRELGRALPFPDYYGGTWDAFGDSLGELLRDSVGGTALIVVGADEFAHSDLHGFIRSVHLLLEAAKEANQMDSGLAQFEVFFIGSFDQLDR